MDNVLATILIGFIYFLFGVAALLFVISCIISVLTDVWGNFMPHRIWQFPLAIGVFYVIGRIVR